MSNDVRARIRAEMQAVFPAHDPNIMPFYAMQEYHLGWRNHSFAPEYSDPGKLLRPIVTLMACELFGGRSEDAMPIAAAVQLLHDFSLIHDDIEDNSDLRRGRATVWSIWGIAQGINAGDGMFVLAHLAMQRLADTGMDAQRVLDILRRFDRAILSICEGQYLDMSFEGNIAISEAEYIAMITRKTAVLLAACCELGALAGGASASDAQALYDFGLHVGISFQMQDDILGIWGDASVTGKPDAADLLRRKLSLPVIYTLAQEPAQGALHQLYQTPAGQDDGLAAALAAIDTYGARAAVAHQAQMHYEHACVALARANVTNESMRRELQLLADQLLGRNS